MAFLTRSACLMALGLMAVGAILPVGCAVKYTDFGEPITIQPAQAVPVNKVLADPTAYDDKYVLVAGTVDEVCARKGCWLTMTDEHTTDTVFVKFTCPVEGRLIPTKALGHKVFVEGTIQVTEISEEEARHYQQDQGASPADIGRIVGAQKQVRIDSPAARIKGVWSASD